MQTELENLKLVLTSPRERARGTITSYLQTGKTFLTWLDGNKVPTGDKEPAKREATLIFRRYFVFRMEQGISKRTRAKEFVQLQKLASANNWPWTFTTDDRPMADDDPFAPAHTPEEVKTIIEARDKFSKTELFYVAVATTWGSRREEMIRLRKRDYDDKTLKIKTAKHGRPVIHLIPDEINAILQAHHPELKDTNSLSRIYYRILKKAEVPRVKGYGWHSFRRSLRTILEWNLAEARLPLSLVADFMGWSKTQKGVVYGGSPMLGVYSHPEILSSDPYAIERMILEVHPFLKFWRGEEGNHGADTESK